MALLLPLITVAIAATARSEEVAPIALHPDNPHYFTWRGKSTILVTSGEHYGALLNLDFDFDRYFMALKKDGLNHTRLFSGTYREIPNSFGITDNTLAPKANRYLAPWARSDTPGYFDGGNKFDLSKWDDAYFDRLKKLLTAAREAGVVVEFNLFCPLYNDELWRASPLNARNNVNNVGDYMRTEALTLKRPSLVDVQLAFVRKVVAEVNAFDNLYFEVCNEPYFAGVAMDWQHKVADVIHETESKLPHKHLVSMNIANGRAKVDKPHPGVSIYNFHYCVPPDAVAMNYHLNSAIGENETGFRGQDDLLYRTEAWDFLLAGGGLYNNLDYSFTPGTPDGTLRGYRSPGGGSPELRKQLGVLKRFLEGFDFVRMKPDAAVVKSTSEKLTVAALVEPGKQYAINLHVPLPEKPKNVRDHKRAGIETTLTLDLPKGRYATEWLNTHTGEVMKRETFDHDGGERSLASPKFDDDVALRVARSS